jgi:hypothetical protein
MSIEHMSENTNISKIAQTVEAAKADFRTGIKAIDPRVISRVKAEVEKRRTITHLSSKLKEGGYSAAHLPMPEPELASEDPKKHSEMVARFKTVARTVNEAIDQNVPLGFVAPLATETFQAGVKDPGKSETIVKAAKVISEMKKVPADKIASLAVETATIGSDAPTSRSTPLRKRDTENETDEGVEETKKTSDEPEAPIEEVPAVLGDMGDFVANILATKSSDRVITRNPVIPQEPAPGKARQ